MRFCARKWLRGESPGYFGYHGYFRYYGYVTGAMLTLPNLFIQVHDKYRPYMNYKSLSKYSDLPMYSRKPGDIDISVDFSEPEKETKNKQFLYVGWLFGYFTFCISCWGQVMSNEILTEG
jgi:hypothetical protein